MPQSLQMIPHLLDCQELWYNERQLRRRKLLLRASPHHPRTQLSNSRKPMTRTAHAILPGGQAPASAIKGHQQLNQATDQLDILTSCIASFGSLHRKTQSGDQTVE